jgi:hypothetical protein
MIEARQRLTHRCVLRQKWNIWSLVLSHVIEEAKDKVRIPIRHRSDAFEIPPTAVGGLFRPNLHEQVSSAIKSHQPQLVD